MGCSKEMLIKNKNDTTVYFTMWLWRGDFVFIDEFTIYDFEKMLSAKHMCKINARGRSLITAAVR